MRALYAKTESLFEMKVSVAKLSAWFLIIGALCNFALIPWFIYKSITNDASYDYLLIFSYGIAIIFFKTETSTI